MKKIVVITLVVAMLIFSGCSFSVTTANVTDPTMTTDVQNGEPVDEVTEYAQDAEQLVAVGILNNAPDDTKITFVWNYVTDPQTFNEVEMNSEGESGIYIFSTMTNDGLWPVGDYNVEMYIDDREEPDATATFSIK